MSGLPSLPGSAGTPSETTRIWMGTSDMLRLREISATWLKKMLKSDSPSGLTVSQALRSAWICSTVLSWKSWMGRKDFSSETDCPPMTPMNRSRAGVLILLDGLHPPSMGARVSFATGKPVVTDGPFTEAKEVLGGYWMINVKSREEAIAWAKKCPASGNEIIEIRQVQEMADFSEEVQQAAHGFDELQKGNAHKAR